MGNSQSSPDKLQKISTHDNSLCVLENPTFQVQNQIVLTHQDFLTAKGSHPFGVRPEGMLLGKERRNRITSLKPNTLEGSQGQLIVKINGDIHLGTGTLCHFEDSKRMFVLSCAHNFYQASSRNKGQGWKAESITYHHCKENSKKWLKEDRICQVDLFPRYAETSNLMEALMEGYDIAIGTLKNEGFSAFMFKESYLSYFEKENPEKGDVIYVLGYPGEKEKNGCLYGMKGTIADFIRNEEKGTQVILYENIDTTPGQSGSPLYLKRGNKWAIIGVHVGTIEKMNAATAITQKIYGWIASKFIEVPENLKSIFNRHPLEMTEIILKFRISSEGASVLDKNLWKIILSQNTTSISSIEEWRGKIFQKIVESIQEKMQVLYVESESSLDLMNLTKEPDFEEFFNEYFEQAYTIISDVDMDHSTPEANIWAITLKVLNVLPKKVKETLKRRLDSLNQRQKMIMNTLSEDPNIQLVIDLNMLESSVEDAFATLSESLLSEKTLSMMNLYSKVTNFLLRSSLNLDKKAYIRDLIWKKLLASLNDSKDNINACSAKLINSYWRNLDRSKSSIIQSMSKLCFS